MKKMILASILTLISNTALAAWVYQVKQYQVHGLTKEGASFLQKEFNVLGAQGWEIVSMTYDSEEGQFLVTYKKEAN